MTKQSIREDLFKLADEKYKKFHTNLCPGTNNIIGIRVTVLREYAEKLSKENWKENFDKIGNDYYEEIMLQGMIIGLASKDVEETKKYLKKFIPKIDNWAVCDVCTAGLKITKKHKQEMWEFVQIYLKSEKEFELRFAIVMMLDFFIVEEYIDKVLIELNKVKHYGYYVKMAVAWTVSICYIKFKDKTDKFLHNNNLDDFTYNKAIQKILESYRVDSKDKEELRKRKR